MYLIHGKSGAFPFCLDNATLTQAIPICPLFSLNPENGAVGIVAVLWECG